MIAILVLCLLACAAWALSTVRRRPGHDSQHSVEGFHRVLEAIDPGPRQVRRR